MVDAQAHRVMVTGGARGIGAAVACALVQAGAHVTIADEFDEEGRALAGLLGGRARYVHLDVSSALNWAEAVSIAEREAGPLTALVNSAGVLRPGSARPGDEEGLRRTLNSNFIGAWLGMGAVLPSLRRSRRGVIVNVSATAGLRRCPGVEPYVAARQALRGLTRTAALEMASDTVRVVSVLPGPAAGSGAGASGGVAGGQPPPVFGDPKRVADTVLLLLRGTAPSGREFAQEGTEAAAAASDALL